MKSDILYEYEYACKVCRKNYIHTTVNKSKKKKFVLNAKENNE